MHLRLVFILLACTLFSCSDERVDQANSIESDEVDEALPEIRGTLFELALRDDLSEPCAFLLECDCCVGDLLLRDDGTFYHLEYCVQERFLYTGNYLIQGNILTLTYGNKMATERIEWKEDTDGGSDQVDYESTQIPPQTTRFTVTMCADRLRLDDESETFVGLQVLHEGGKVLFGSIHTDPLVRFLSSEFKK